MIYLQLDQKQAANLIKTGMFTPLVRITKGKSTFYLEPTPDAAKTEEGEPVGWQLKTARHKIRKFSDLNRLAKLLADLGITSFEVRIEDAK